MERPEQSIKLITRCKHDWVKTHDRELRLQCRTKKYECSKCRITKEHSHAFASDSERISYSSGDYKFITKLIVWPPDDRYTKEYYNTKYKKSQEIIDDFEKEGDRSWTR